MTGRPRAACWTLAGLTLLVVGLFLASLLIGPALIAPSRALAALATGEDPIAALVMRSIRLPRALLALLIGAGLGASGAALQGYLRNPLAEPGLLGISGAAETPE